MKRVYAVAVRSRGTPLTRVSSVGPSLEPMESDWISKPRPRIICRFAPLSLKAMT
ncbi:hypothetical protein [Kitasatospora sp. NPDC058218]|uniref:hypothetical protein n=1 Tax=Kitasatospora sp. NPDC058218 TaxID=3346385 RepID=UPI0036D98193